MNIIDVAIPGREHQIVVAPGLLGRVGASLLAHGLSGPAFVVTSPRIYRLHGLRLGTAPPGRSWHVLKVPEGESSKTLDTVSRLYTRLIRLGADRSAILVAMGGGVIGDLAGFAAATYLRGIRLVQLPTTLLAQIDSSIGGKVGVNHPSGKNLIGAFHQPALILMDPELLLTLPEREWRSGLFEAVKYGVIASPSLFRFLETHLEQLLRRDLRAVTRLVTECARIKADVVTADERESGLRMILNLGHTVGHALETVCGYGRLRHGEAVGWGMLFAARHAESLKLLESRSARRVEALITGVGLPALPRLQAREILSVAGRDKKRKGSTLRLVLPLRIGKVTVEEVPEPARLKESLRACGIVR